MLIISLPTQKRFLYWQRINFTIKGGDKQDDYLDAYLNFDDGKQHNFKLRKTKFMSKIILTTMRVFIILV